MKFGVISLFPGLIRSLEDRSKFGLVGKAFENGLAELFIEDLRDFGLGRHKVVDGTPYGGGDGMVLRPEPIQEALEALLNKMNLAEDKVHRVYACPSGELWTQNMAESFIHSSPNKEGIVLLCGRYAGADSRVIEALFDTKVSLGPFILNGGELPSLCIIETLVRLLPGVLGNPESAKEDSFSKDLRAIEAEPYTKPQSWEGREVPGVLLSGDHSKIEEYRELRSAKRTQDWADQAIEAVRSSVSLKK